MFLPYSNRSYPHQKLLKFLLIPPRRGCFSGVKLPHLHPPKRAKEISKTIGPVSIAAAGLSIALGPAVAGFFIYKGLTESRMADRYVTVKGLVERVEKADFGTAMITYKVAGDNLMEMNKELSRHSKLIQTFLEKAGFESNEISVGGHV